MNEHASNAPQPNDEASPPQDEASSPQDAGSPPQDPGSGAEEQTDVVVTAKLVTEAPIRRGSPFASDPHSVKPIDNFMDVGPIRYTAMGAVAASIVVLVFAAAATFWFPAGGTMIAALGCGLSIFGLYSSYRISSAALLTVHLSLFVVCYGLALS